MKSKLIPNLLDLITIFCLSAATAPDWPHWPKRNGPNSGARAEAVGGLLCRNAPSTMERP